MNNEIDIYFFGSPDCEVCKKYLPLVIDIADKYHCPIYFINGSDYENEDIQNFCDLHAVAEYPHIKIYNSQNLVLEQISTIDIEEVENTLSIINDNS